MSDGYRVPFRAPEPADDGGSPRVIAFAVMGLLAGEPAVAHWREGERLECDRELAVVAHGMVAAGVQVAADGQLADLEGPPEVAAMTLAAALSEITTATLDLSVAPADLPGSCFRGSEPR